MGSTAREVVIGVQVQFVGRQQGRVVGNESFQEEMGRTLGRRRTGRLLDDRNGRTTVNLFSEPYSLPL